MNLTGTFCLCSKGWVKAIFETLLKKPVEIELRKCIGRGARAAGVESGKIALKEFRGEGIHVVSELAHAKGLEIIALSDDMIHFKNLQCPYDLKGTTARWLVPKFIYN